MLDYFNDEEKEKGFTSFLIKFKTGKPFHYG